MAVSKRGPQSNGEKLLLEARIGQLRVWECLGLAPFRVEALGLRLGLGLARVGSLEKTRGYRSDLGFVTPRPTELTC